MIAQAYHVTYRGDNRNCIDHSGSGITSARITATFDGVELSCVASNFGDGTGAATVEWNTGDTSKIDLNIDETVLNTAKVSGSVTEGPFQGQRFSGEFDTSLLKGAGKCTAGALFGGVQSAGFKGHFSIS